MNWYQMLRAWRARTGLMAVVFLTTVVTAVVVTLLLPRTYSAAASLLIESRDAQSLASGTRDMNFYTPQERQSYLQTQIDILGSRKVARKVIDRLGLADADARAEFLEETGGVGTLEDWLSDRLLRNLKVMATQSNVLQAVYSSPDAERAALIANAFADAYLETLLELRNSPSRNAAAWLDEQLAGLRRNLDSAQSQLTAFMRKHKLAGPDERYDLQGARVAALNDQSLRAREQAAQGNAREAATRQYLAAGGDPSRLPEITDNLMIQRLRADLTAAESRLQELATQYGPNHPAYQRQESQTNALRERVDAETAKLLSSLEHAARQNRQREANAAGQVASEREQQLAQRAALDEASVLRRNVESAARAYDLALQRAAVAQIEGQARSSNVVLLGAAVPPRVPSSPRIYLNVAVSVVVGTMLALALALLLELRDRRVRAPSDLVLAVDLPLLGAISSWNGARPMLADGEQRGRRLLTGPS